MFHQTMQLADAYGVPVQIHTGIQAGNRGVVTNSRPTLLTNIFLLYPRISFDLFHISYPYQNELSALAKSFPNVYADFCWAHVISPEVARRTMAEFLDTVPVNKIFGFGGDYHYPELSYAHAKMARQILQTCWRKRWKMVPARKKKPSILGECCCMTMRHASL